MAALGGLIQALVTGGEAVPVFPSFNKVMLVDGRLVEPKRVVPVYGLDGKVLFGSEVGVQLDRKKLDPENLPIGGPPKVVNFNEFEHLEGGRVTKKLTKTKSAARRGGKGPVRSGSGRNGKKKKGPELQVGKRRKLNLTEDDLVPSDEDEEYAPKGPLPGPTDRVTRPWCKP